MGKVSQHKPCIDQMQGFFVTSWQMLKNVKTWETA